MNAGLDAAVVAAARDLGARGAPPPDVLVFTALGLGFLPSRLARSTRFPLARTEGVPPAWRESVVIAGGFGGGTAWLVEDAPLDVDEREAPAWQRAFPCWLAAQAGARMCAHLSAGVALPIEREPLRPGPLALVRAHVNLSGATPLLGLGASKLGPLFPDQSRTHHSGLRARALEHARALGIGAREAIAICTSGPALETEAERAFFARAGGDVAVSELGHVAIACAHAGLSALCVVGVTDSGGGHADLKSLVARAEKLAPAIEELVSACANDLVRAARAERAES